MTKSEIIRKLDDIVNFDYEDDPTRPKRGSVLKAGAAVGVGVGGTLGHQAIRNTGGYAANIRKLSPAAGNLGERISTAGAPKIGNFVAGIPRKAAGLVNKVTPYKNAAARTGADILKRARSLFSDRSTPIEFALSPIEQNAKFKGQKPQNNMRRGVGIGLLGGGYSGAIAGGLDAAKYANRGFVYKKRDALGHALIGSSIGGAAGAVAGVTAAAHGISHSGLIGTGVGIGTGILAQRALAGHTLKKREAERKNYQAMSAKLDDIISFKAIDLGDSPECMPDMCSPSKKYFPTLYVSGREKPLDMPDEGEATVKYRVRSRSMNRYGDEKEKHSADIEIHSIDPIKGSGEKKGKAKLLKIQPNLATLSSKIDSIINFDSRPRDPMGQFSNQEEGAPNPNDMAKVYSRAQRTGIAEGAGAATIGGVGAHVGKSMYDALLTKVRASRAVK